MLGYDNMAYIITNDQKFVLDENKELVLGRACHDFALHDECLSRKHCQISANGSDFYIKDLGSFNGTFVNGEKIDNVKLHDQDIIHIGNTSLTFYSEQPNSEESNNKLSLEEFENKYILYFPQTKTYISLTSPSYSIGRKQDNTIYLPSNQISARHAELKYHDHGWWITDLDSRNGVIINHKKEASALLQVGDIVQLGDVYFIFRDAAHKKNSKKNNSSKLNAIIICFFLIAICCSIFLFYSQNSILEYPNNMISDYSFENGLVWECSGKMTFQTNEAKSGKSTLACIFNSPNGQKNECHYCNPLQVTEEKSYQISFWTKCQQLDGVAGLCLSWYDHNDKKLWDEHAPLIDKKYTDWTKLEYVITPPLTAKTLRIHFFVKGLASSILIDDLIIEEAVTYSPRTQYLYNTMLRLIPDIHQKIHIFAGKQYLFDLGSIDIFSMQDDKTLLVSSQNYSIFTLIDSQKNYAKLTSNLYTLSDDENIELQIKFLLKDNIFSIQYQLQWEQSRNLHYFTINVPEEGLEFLMDLIHNQSFPIIWKLPNKNKKLTCLVKSLKKLPVRSENKLRKIQYSIPAQSSKQATFEVTLQMYDETESSQYKNLNEQAFQLQQNQYYGQAWQLYSRVSQECIVPKILDEANEQLANLENQFQEDYKNVVRLGENATFFQNTASYKKVDDACKLYEKRWENYEKSHMFIDIATKYRAEQEKIQKEQQNQHASVLRQKAEDLQQNGQKKLAILFYEEILLQYPLYPEREDIEKLIQALKKK